MIPKTNKEFSRLAGSGLPRNAGKLHNDPAKYQSGVQRPTAARGQEAQAQQSAEQAAAKDGALRSAGLVGAGAGLLSKAVSAVSPKRSDRFTNEDWANLQRTVWKKTHEKQLEQVKNRLEARGALTDVPTRATAATSRQLQEQLMEHEQRATPAAVNAIGGSDAYQLLKRLRADFFLDWSKKTTDQQREALEHSGLTRQEWWKLLNLDEHYLETLSDIRNIREHRGAYGLSPKEADEVYGRLIDLASSRAFASGREAPFTSPGVRNTFLEMLRDDEAALFESIGYVRGRAPSARGGTQTAYGRIDGSGAAHIRQGDGIGKTRPAWYDKNDVVAEPPAPQTFGNVLKALFLSLLFPYGCAPAPDTPKPSATPGSTPQTVMLDLLPTPTNAPATPTPEPTPEPTLEPDAYRKMIEGIVKNGRMSNPDFFSVYTQAQSEQEKKDGVQRKDCSAQIYSFYSVLRDRRNSPFYGADHITCLGLFDKYKVASNIPNGWTVYSELSNLNNNGQPNIPENWRELAETGDIALFRKGNSKDWHVVLCLGDEQVLDRGQWKEGSPSGELETGLFVRDFDDLPSGYDLVMMIDPGKEALTMSELILYLENPPDSNALLQ